MYFDFCDFFAFFLCNIAHSLYKKERFWSDTSQTRNSMLLKFSYITDVKNTDETISGPSLHRNAVQMDSVKVLCPTRHK